MHRIIQTVSAFLILIFAGCLLAGCSKKNADPVQMEASSYKRYARITVSDFGSMEFALLDNVEPKITEEFADLARSGYFDDKPVYMVIKDFCMMAGKNPTDPEEPSANLSGGDIASAETGTDGAEEKPKTYPFRGALCITEQSSVINPERFTVIQTQTGFLKELKEMLEFRKVTPAEYYEQAYGVKLDEETIELFDRYGGTPWLYGHCIVFGQLVSGEEVLDKICAASVYDDAQFRPVEDILIESVEVFTR